MSQGRSARRVRAANLPLHVVFGCNGPVGVALMERLVGLGVRVRGVCRSGRSPAPAGAEILAGDAADRAQAVELCQGAGVVYSTIGLDYTRWLELWPPILEGLVAGARAAGARLIFADNLYAYGPQKVPLTEELPLTDYGVKPALRARMTERLLAAHATGEAPVALVRASDFYGPRVLNAMLGERVFPKALAGRPAQLVGDVEAPHAFTYVPDFARALVTVASDDVALGEIWHVPNAPARPIRHIVKEIYRLAGRTPRLRTLPPWLHSLLALVSPQLAELEEMRFQWDRPYLVDHGKFALRFWDDATPLEEGLRTTLEWYRRLPEPRNSSSVNSLDTARPL